MTNNKASYCKVCGKETTFCLESDMLWYCDECEYVEDANIGFENDEEFQEKLEEFEIENGEAIYCKHCNNFCILKDVLENGSCPICSEELESELDKKGYAYCEDSGKYCKVIE